LGRHRRQERLDFGGTALVRKLVPAEIFGVSGRRIPQNFPHLLDPLFGAGLFSRQNFDRVDALLAAAAALALLAVANFSEFVQKFLRPLRRQVEVHRSGGNVKKQFLFVADVFYARNLQL